MVYCISALGVLGIFAIIRMMLGPTIWDRLLTFNQLSTKVVIAMVFYSLMTNQTFLLDIAIVYTLFSFMSSVFIARFVSERGAI
jgi:multicomponent Na+:H+ antiporter subunit F